MTTTTTTTNDTELRAKGGDTETKAITIHYITSSSYIYYYIKMNAYRQGQKVTVL